MDAGTGIGGFSNNQEELAESKFDLFSKVEVETGVKKTVLDLFQHLEVKDLILLSFLKTLINLLMLGVFDFMVKCVSKREILMEF